MSDSTEIGQYGEQGDFATDGAFEDVLSSLGLDEPGRLTSPKPATDDTAPIPGGGFLLEAEASKVFKAIHGIVVRQERPARNREEKAKHWARVRGGVPFSFLEKSEDRSVFRATLPPGVDDIGGQPVPNKMDDLCNKIISQILVDDFLPNPKPDGDADSDRGAADLAKKFLRADGTVSGTDDKALLRDALNMNISAATAGVFVWVDPTAGGWRPKQVQAHPRAEDPSNPLVAPQLGPDGQPVIGMDGSPVMEQAATPVLRYVAEVSQPDSMTGQVTTTLAFTEDAAKAARQWLPKHRRKLLNVNQIRTVPQSSTVFDASSITLLMYDSLGEAKKRFTVLQSLPDEKLKALLQWRPKRWKAIVPEAHRTKDVEGSGSVTDDQLIFWYEHLCRIAPDYPDGAQVCVSGASLSGTTSEGAGVVLLRDTLRDDVEVDNGTTIPVLRDPPVSQFICATDTEDGDPMGMAALAKFGGGKEAWDHIWVGLFEAMHKALNPNSYIPSTSTVTREDVNRRDGTPIEILTKDDKPEFEDPPSLPDYVPSLLERLEVLLNSAAGTNETSNGLDSPYATSGVAKQVAIRSARVALAQYWQNTVKGLTHYWRVKCQLAQAKLTVPQMVKLSGIESAYKQPWFVGSDLAGVSEIALEPGSGTMMSPSEKAQHLAFLQASQWLDPEQAGELARSSMTDDLGLPPNVHEEAVNREIGQWSKGPPPGWLEQYRQYQRETAQLQQTLGPIAGGLVQQGMDQQQAVQMAMQQAGVTQMPVPPSTPFTDLPNHEEPFIAVVRHRAFSRMMSTVEYGKQPPEWQQPFLQRYEAARKAAGVTTVAEQQQAMQAQAQAQQQQAQAQAQAQSAEQDKQLQFKAQEADKEREAKAEEQARARMSNESIATAKAQQSRAARTPLPA